MKKILSFILSILMVIAIVPVSVFVVSAEETQSLYSNSFDSAADVTTNATLGNANVAYNEGQSALQITHDGTWYYSNAYWETSIGLNGTDGLITLTTEIDAEASDVPSDRNATGAILTVNDTVIIQNTSGGRVVTLADGTVVSKACAGNYKENITLTIDPKTGKGTLVFDQTAANKVDGGFAKTTTVDIDLGTIGESITVRYGTNRHPNFYVYSLNVTQVKGNELESPAADDILYSNDFSDASNGADNQDANVSIRDGRLYFTSSGANNWYKTVALNGTDEDVTISFTVYPNWNNVDTNILRINGTTAIYAVTGYKVKLGDDTTSYNSASGQAVYVTIVIEPDTGNAKITYDQSAASYTTRTDDFNVGTIGDGSIEIRFGSGYTNGFSVDDLVVTQGKGSTHTCSFTTSTKPATCTAPGFTVEECLGCGAKTETVSSPVAGHKWGLWVNVDGVAKRACTTCGATETKTVGKIDASKTFLALGDSLTFALKTPGTVNDSWAKKVADRLGMSNYLNKAVHGTEAYHWYSILTGEAAPNGTKYTPSDVINKGLAYDVNFDKAAMTAAIENASVVAFTLGSNDMSKGYLKWRKPEQVCQAIVGFIDAIHEINPDAVVIAVGYAYGLATTIPVESFTGSDDYFVELGSLMTETLNSDAYNSFVYYVDVSKTMSDYKTQSEDLVHPTAAGHIEMADDVIAALGSIAALEGGIVTNPDTTRREESDVYVNHFDGTAPAAGVVNWGATGTDGVLTVAPSTNKHENRLNVGSVDFPGNTIISFKFSIPTLPESGNIYIFHDRASNGMQDYVRVFSAKNEETGATEFWASVGNGTESGKVKIEAGDWYTVVILFASNASSDSSVYINGQFVGTVKGYIVGQKSGNGFANFAGCKADGTQNAATYCIDDFTASTFADETLVKVSGFQKTNVVDGTYNVRFTAAINGILSEQENIGFVIAANYTDENGVPQKKTWVLTTKTVYKSISAKYGTEEITAEQEGAEYLTTVAITNVGYIYDSVEFEVRPYVTVNEVQYYGTTVTVTVHPEA